MCTCVCVCVCKCEWTYRKCLFVYKRVKKIRNEKSVIANVCIWGQVCVCLYANLCVCVYYGGFIKCLETPGGSGEGGVMNK